MKNKLKMFIISAVALLLTLGVALAAPANAGRNPQGNAGSYVLHLGPASVPISVSQQCPPNGDYIIYNIPKNFSSTNWKPWVRAFKVPSGYRIYDTYDKVYYVAGRWHCFPTKGYMYPLRITKV